MPEPPPADLARDAVGDGQEALTPETIEAVLADFRSWLEQIPREAARRIPASSEGEEAVGGRVPIDLHTLLSQLVALRQEVNLQTRASRAQQEQGQEALSELRRALDSLRQSRDSVRQPDRQTEEEVLRPVLKALVDARDALALATPEIERVRSAVIPLLDELTAERAEEPALTQRPARSSWMRLFGWTRPEEASLSAVGHPRASQAELRDAAGRIRQLLDSVLTGYTMSLQRLDRVLPQCGLERIPCAGERFDPEQMEVVAAVPDSGRPQGEVLEEVRPGYRWRGRVFRYAQVSVARSQPG